MFGSLSKICQFYKMIGSQRLPMGIQFNWIIV
nr:MAG TPA: hypothetical protein [Caudoviricetes sp.]